MGRLLRDLRQATGLGETTGADHARAECDEAQSDQKETRVVAIAVRASAPTVIVDRSAARRSSAALRPRLGSFDRGIGRPCQPLLDRVARNMRLGRRVSATARWANSPGRPRGLGRRVLVHTSMVFSGAKIVPMYDRQKPR
jgi:hypothetical protein